MTKRKVCHFVSVCLFPFRLRLETRKGGKTLDYYNTEHYADRTAAEAMRNVMEERAVFLDEEGCLRLAEALVKLAVEDYLRARRCLPCRSAR